MPTNDRHQALTDHHEIDVAVIGGGLAGLVAAATAARHPRAGRIALFEPHEPGGRARVDDRHGFALGRGSRALYLSGEALPLLGDLGVDVTTGGAPNYGAARYRVGNRLEVLPQGALSLLRNRPMGWAEKGRFVMLLTRVLRARPEDHQGEGFETLLRRWGGRGTAADLVRTVARTTSYLADFEDADAAVVLRQIQRGLSPGVRYLDGGWGPMVSALTRTVTEAGVDIHRTGVRGVARDSSGVGGGVGGGREVRGWRVVTDAGTWTAEAVVVAAGSARMAAGLLGGPVPGSERLGPPVTQACLELGLRRPPRHPLILGVGEPLYLSLLAPPARMAPDGMALLQVARYHRAGDGMTAERQRQWLWDAARQAGVADTDVVVQRFLASMTVMTARPLASTGGLAGRPPVAHPDLDGVFVAGDWVGPVGLLGDASVSSGAEAGRRAVTFAAERAKLGVS